MNRVLLVCILCSVLFQCRITVHPKVVPCTTDMECCVLNPHLPCE